MVLEVIELISSRSTSLLMVGMKSRHDIDLVLDEVNTYSMIKLIRIQ